MLVVILYADSTGHVALASTGLPINFYLSYFPPKTISGPGFRLHKFVDDQRHHPSMVVVLPTQESCGYGLSEQGAYEWYAKKFIKDNESFSWFTNNCASKVFEALCAAQTTAHSLNFQLISAGALFWKTPGSVMSYAINLANKLQQTHPDQNPLLKDLIDLKACFDIDKQLSPYGLAALLFEKMRKLLSNEYAIEFAQPFCEGVKKSLQLYRRLSAGHCPAAMHNVISELTAEYGLSNEDMVIHLVRLQQLRKYVDEHHGESQLLLDRAIINGLLSTVKEFITRLNPNVLGEKERINIFMHTIAKKIVDADNPHARYFSKGDDMRALFPGMGVTRQM